MGKKKTARQVRQDLVEVKRTIGHDSTGKAIRKSFYGKTKREANEAYEVYMEKLRSKAPAVIDATMTFRQWSSIWLTTYIQDSGITDETYRFTYKNTVEKHLDPYFDNVVVADIKPADIQNFFKEKSSLSESAVHKCSFILRSIFDYAVDNDVIARSPYRNIRTPSGKAAAKKQAYTKEQERIHLDFCKGHPHGLIAALPLKTSVSRSEAAALMVSDFDIENQVLHINKGLTVSGQIGSGKTKNRRRYVPYDNELAEMLSAYLPSASGLFLFTLPDGRPLGPEGIVYRYEQFRRDLLAAHPELPPLNYHELRHTYATLRNEDGVPTNTIALLMGHGLDSKITNDVYIHQNMEHIKQALGLIGPVEKPTPKTLVKRLPKSTTKVRHFSPKSSQKWG